MNLMLLALAKSLAKVFSKNSFHDPPGKRTRNSSARAAWTLVENGSAPVRPALAANRRKSRRLVMDLIMRVPLWAGGSEGRPAALPEEAFSFQRVVGWRRR